MKEATPISRRDALSTLGMLMVAAVSHLLPSSSNASIDDASEALNRILDGNPAVHRIGTAYLKQRADESDPKTLLAALDGIVDRRDLQNWRQSGPDNVETSIRMRIRADFSNGETFNCDGWILSLTEVRLCAAAITIPDIGFGMRSERRLKS